MSDPVDLLREFRADVPAASVETRRQIYARATQQPEVRTRIRGFAALIRRPAVSVANATHPRMLRWGIGLAALLAVAGAAAAYATVTASGDTGVSSLVAQVQKSFGDGLLVSGSVSGPTLTVTVASSDEPSAVKAAFEAQMLARAVRDSQSASSQIPISSVEYIDSDGNPLAGYGSDPVGSESALASLARGACTLAAKAAEAADTSLSNASVLTLTYGSGACAFRFETTNPTASAANAPTTIASLVNAIGDPNQRPYLVEIDDQAGTPQFVASYTPNAGGVSYIKPGLSTGFVDGGGARIGG